MQVLRNRFEDDRILKSKVLFDENCKKQSDAMIT